MARYAIIDGGNLVTNVIEMERGANWQPPAGHRVIISNTASPGDTHDGRRFTPPQPAIRLQTPRERYAEAATVDAKVALIAEELGLTERQ